MMLLLKAVAVLCLVQGLLADDVVPNYTEYAKMARYVVHKVDWTAMGTISSDSDIETFPMVNVVSMADSALNETSTGEIYFLMTDLDYTGKDLQRANKLTALFTMEQYRRCSDPMEPTCARIIVTGKMVRVDEDHPEYNFGRRAMLSRHPVAENWILTHNFYLCKIDIMQIIVVDYYGGANVVTKEEYFAANPDRRPPRTYRRQMRPTARRRSEVMTPY